MKTHIFKYLLFFILNVIVINTILYTYLRRNIKNEEATIMSGTLQEKLNYYKLHKNEYKIVFIGDSRTYDNFDNNLIDSLFGCKSINLGMNANWFPTQYPFLQDLLPEIPEGVTLVWSMGFQNFKHSSTLTQLEDVYPIKLGNAITYCKWGFSPTSLTKNLKKYEFQSFLLAQHEWMKYWIISLIDKKIYTKKYLQNDPVATNQITKPLVNLDKYNQLQNDLKDRGTLVIREMLSGDTITSAEVFWNKGNYWRVEFDSIYFRNKQRLDKIEREKIAKTGKDFIPDEQYWNNFKGIVQLLKPYQGKLKIIVNEFEEASYLYNDSEKKKFNLSMDKVKTFLRGQGFKKIVNGSDSTLIMSDYFDFTHLNNKGAIKFTKHFYQLVNK